VGSAGGMAASKNRRAMAAKALNNGGDEMAVKIWRNQTASNGGEYQRSGNEMVLMK
jgi:hypothetical protein